MGFSRKYFIISIVLSAFVVQKCNTEKTREGEAALFLFDAKDKDVTGVATFSSAAPQFFINSASGNAQ